MTFREFLMQAATYLVLAGSILYVIVIITYVGKLVFGHKHKFTEPAYLYAVENQTPVMVYHLTEGSCQCGEMLSKDKLDKAKTKLGFSPAGDFWSSCNSSEINKMKLYYDSKKGWIATRLKV